ncbi:MAG: hypothetical protein ACE3JK_14110 [Sporolactobacillus sp.]
MNSVFDDVSPLFCWNPIDANMVHVAEIIGNLFETLELLKAGDRIWRCKKQKHRQSVGCGRIGNAG